MYFSPWWMQVAVQKMHRNASVWFIYCRSRLPTTAYQDPSWQHIMWAFCRQCRKALTFINWYSAQVKGHNVIPKPVTWKASILAIFFGIRFGVFSLVQGSESDWFLACFLEAGVKTYSLQQKVRWQWRRRTRKWAVRKCTPLKPNTRFILCRTKIMP